MQDSSPASGSKPVDSSPGLLQSAISRPITVVAAVLLVLLFGTLAVFELPVQLTPDITLPTVSVRTAWPGASPVEVESEILKEQEEVLQRVPGLVRVESTARANQGSIDLEFRVGTDLEQALVRVSNQLSQVPDYPASADEPVVSTARATGPPLAVILIRHEHGGSIAPYRTWVDEAIIPELERIRGVASVYVRGGQRSEVHVEFDTVALAARRLTVPMVAAQIRSELRDSSGGDVEVGKRRLLVRTRIAPASAAELEDVVLQTADDGTAVLLGDVARVTSGLRKATDFAIGNDRESIALLPRREAGTNVLQVTEELRQVVVKLNEERFEPEGLRIEVVDDQSSYIRGSLNQVRTNLLIGAVLAIVVLFLFLRSFSAAGVIALAIPISVFATAAIMAILGRTVNVVSLAGITFAVGMVVDNSIVALESIDTWRRKLPPWEAASRGIREIRGALVASTATTAAVFIPILLWEGEVGQLLRDVAYAIAISVIVSFFVSVLVIPSFAAAAFRLRDRRRGKGRRSDTAANLMLSWMERRRVGLSRGVARVAGSVPLAALVVVAALGGSISVTWLLLPKMEYLPTGNRNLVFGVVLPPPGHSVPDLRATGFANQRVMMHHTGRTVGDVPAIQRSFFVGDPSRLFVGAVAQDPRDVRAMRDFMKGLHSRIPGVINFASQAALFSRGIGQGRAIDLELSGSQLPALIGTGRKLFGELRSLLPGAQVRPDPVLDEGAPELHVLPQRQQAKSLGFSAAELGLVVDAYVDGTIIGEYGAEGRPQRDVVLRSSALTPVQDDLSLLSAPVATPSGSIVPFSSLAKVETRLGPSVVKRLERSRAVVLRVTPPDEMPFEAALEKVEARVAELQREGFFPKGIKVGLGGSAGKLAAAQQQFSGILLLALAILALLLTGLYQDFLVPWVVLVTVPLATAGGVLGLWFGKLLGTELPLDLMTAVGFLILLGVVVNNAILVVDVALQELRRGATVPDAVAAAVRARVRPILMSALTSLAGLAPMVIGSGSGSELYRGVGAVVLGGLALSTGLSLLVVPSLLSLVWRFRQRLLGSVGVNVERPAGEVGEPIRGGARGE